MTPTMIIDCSIAMAWCFADERTDATDAIQDRMIAEAALVPPHWFLEVTNVLAVAERRNRISEKAANLFVELLGRLEIHVDESEPARAFQHLLPLCREHGLTSYDAAYLELAVRTKLPLATLDAALRTAATKAGVHLLGQ